MTKTEKTAAENLASLISDLGKGSSTVQLQSGTCIYRDGFWRISRGGLELDSVIWLESASPRTGPCLLAIDTPANGQSTAFVLGFTFSDAFRMKDTATATSNAAFGKCNLLFDNGDSWTDARTMAHYSPATNDRVFLIWKGGEPYVVGGFAFGHSGVNAPKPPALPDLPRAVPYGSSQFPALQYRTWDSLTGTWSATNTRDVRLTTTQYGIWTYGGATKGLSDKSTIESMTFTLGKRVLSGSQGSDVVVSFYRSDAETLGDTLPSQQEGPFNVTIPRAYKGAPIDLPVELATAMKQGGSITLKVTGDLTFVDSPASGYINVKWRNN